MEAELNNFAFGQRAKPSPRPDLPKDLREALHELGLTWPLTMAALKARYKQLAKRHHPDMNQGNEQGSEKLKRINLAYATLRGKLAAEAQPG
ncbi:J domain-containing protein [Acidocella sp.]|nr:J domain-containing protein [Acidocella sp.]